jgi:hypothetical protein
VAVQDVRDKLADWSLRFRTGEMTVDDVQEAFAALTELEISDLPGDICVALAEARQELDAIRFGMCESGQTGEISRIFGRLDSLLPGSG